MKGEVERIPGPENSLPSTWYIRRGLSSTQAKAKETFLALRVNHSVETSGKDRHPKIRMQTQSWRNPRALKDGGLGA